MVKAAQLTKRAKLATAGLAKLGGRLAKLAARLTKLAKRLTSPTSKLANAIRKIPKVGELEMIFGLKSFCYIVSTP